MSLQPLPSRRFIRKTQLAANEYRKDFQQIDRDVLSVITSEGADRVTKCMSKIYLRLANAPGRFLEKEGILRIEAEVRGCRKVKAWTVLCELVGVSSATANKAIRWLHQQGVIGYCAGKNGVGIRIFLNRAAASIGVRQPPAAKKILTFPPASNSDARASRNEPAFKDSEAVLEVLDTDINSDAPKNGAERERADTTPLQTKQEEEPDNTPPEPAPAVEPLAKTGRESSPRGAESSSQSGLNPFLFEALILRLTAQLEPAIRMAAHQAAAEEHERTRQWMEKSGLPKAARVAQREAYDVLRRYGLINESARSFGSGSGTGRSDYRPAAPHSLSTAEVAEMAGACIAMLETRGQAIELTLSEMSMEAGGFLMPEDAPRVREKAIALLSECESRDEEGERINSMMGIHESSKARTAPEAPATAARRSSLDCGRSSHSSGRISQTLCPVSGKS